MLDEVKVLLGITTTDRDDLLNILINNITRQLEMRLGNPDGGIPMELEYIVSELTVARFNRLGSEGMVSESVEGHSIAFNQDDFAPYSYVIQLYLGDLDDFKPRRGAIRAL